MSTMLKFVLVSLILTVVSLVVLQFIDPNVQKNSINGAQISENDDDADTFSVSISGEVRTTGTYIVSSGCSLGDLIATAGGATTNADELCYDESYAIEKNGSYYIAPLYDTANVCSNTKIVKYNINSCTSDDLVNISGIGSTIATNIIKYRDEVSSFKCLEDVMNVNGIGSSTFVKLRNYIKLREA